MKIDSVYVIVKRRKDYAAEDRDVLVSCAYVNEATANDALAIYECEPDYFLFVERLALDYE